ncbi:MAG: DUF1460 domain-containing protein, partial [Saprospiraceae bacterium]|nr:DUF1460 domain-containing protein [Saprospiraceae bacterium]
MVERTNTGTLARLLKGIGLFSLLLPCLWMFRQEGAVVGEYAASEPSSPPLVCQSGNDSLLFLEKQKIALGESGLTARTLAVARSFIGTPYVNGCLDRNPEECLAVNLCELDCWTFMENSLAIALAASGDYSSYKNQLQELRYWGGYINGYGSRIHYFSGWLLHNEKKG